MHEQLTHSGTYKYSSTQLFKQSILAFRIHISTFMVALLALLFAACGSDNNEADVIAEACGHKLYRSDLEGVISPGLSKEDSITVATNYIDQWIQQTVVMDQASKEINKDFEKELENYRASLLTYEYEQLVIDRTLDTVVSNRELSEYYNNHRDDFTLQTSIVKAIFVKFDRDAPPVKNVTKLMAEKEISDKDMDQIQKAAVQYGRDYNFDADVWIPFYKFQTMVPITTYNEELYLKNNRNIVIEDSTDIYIAKILDYRLGEQLSPISYEIERIKNIILNQRRIEIVKQMQRNLLSRAMEEGLIKKYR